MNAVGPVTPGNQQRHGRLRTAVVAAVALTLGGTALAPASADNDAVTMVADLVAGTASSEPDELTAVGNTLFFTVDDGTTGTELWTSDGTAAGTIRRSVPPSW